jgi:hypothetical protein
VSLRHPFAAWASHPPIGCDVCAVITRVAFWFGVAAGTAGTALLLLAARLSGMA